MMLRLVIARKPHHRSGRRLLSSSLSSVFTLRGDECTGELESITRAMLQLETFLGRNGLTLDKPAAANGLVDRSQDLDPVMAKICHWIHGSYTNKCAHEEVIVPAVEGDHNVRVLIHTPKDYMPPKGGGPALIYAHGGGFMHFSADSYKPVLSRFASVLNVPVYSVDVRLAPEHKCPAAAIDVYNVLQWLHQPQQAHDNKIDTSRIGLAGESSGGHAILGTCIMLAQRNESHLVKCAFPDITPCTNYLLKTPKHEMHWVNQQSTQIHPPWMNQHSVYKHYENPNFGHFMWRNVSQDESLDDYDDADPSYLFPGQMDDEIMSRVPPMVVSSTEFCFFVQDAIHLASRLQSHGKLLDSYVLPGALHVQWIFGLPGTQQYFADRKRLYDRHLASS